MKFSKIFSAVVFAVTIITGSFSSSPVMAADSNEMRNMSTMELVQDMGIGINIGNTFEAAGDWIAEYSSGTVNDYETAWGSPTVTKKMIQGYADEGFGVLRIPVAWSNRMANDGTYTIDKEWMARITQIVDWTLETGMYAIVNIHWDNGWVNTFPENKDQCMTRFTHMWEQISDNFKDYGDHLMFEAQNEELGWETLWNRWAGDSGKTESYALVNEVNQKFVSTVRASGGNNTYRHLLISGYNTGIDLTCDPLFEIPYDPVNRLAVSVHYYTPAGFAILEEDADWGKAISTWGTEADFQELYGWMDMMKASFIDKGIPVIVGEYGCPIKNKDPDSVRLFLSSVCKAAFERELCPVLWDTPGGQYDREECKLTDTKLKEAYTEIVSTRQKPDNGNDNNDKTVYFHDTFESGSDSWLGRGPAKAVPVSDTSFAGSGSLAVTGREASWNGAAKDLDSSVFIPGRKYSFSANVMYQSGGASDTFCMKLQYKDADGQVNYSPIAEAETVKGAWVQLSNTSYQIPAGATDIQIYIETADSTNSFFVDEVIAASDGTVIDGAGGTKKLIYGDVNYDGIINVFDAALARRLLTITSSSNQAALKAADVDRSGKLEVNDLVLIQQFIVGKIKEFPIPPKPDNEWDDYTETASSEWISFYNNSICNMGNTYRLTQKLEAAESGKPLTLAYLGGSITEGKNYSTPFSDYVKSTFANGSFKEVNAGLSGTSSVVGLVRSEKDIVSQNPDIIVIEFSVNDHEGEMYKKSFESLIKKFLSMPNEPAVVVLITRSKGGFSSQAQMEAAGRNFDVPVISMDNALTKGFNSGLLTADDYFSDEYHPHAKGGQLIADCMAYYLRQAMKTDNRSDSYTIPTTSAYGSEYSTCINASEGDLQSFNAGSFTSGTGYGFLPYGYTFQKNSANTPMTFKTTGKGLIIVFKANSSGMGDLLVTVNGKTTTISGNKLYTWGGPDAELGYFQNTSGELDVSIKMENAGLDFTIWGIGVIK